MQDQIGGFYLLGFFVWVDVYSYLEFQGIFNPLFLQNNVNILEVKLRNKSWKPEYVLNFNMDWWILVFYLEPEVRIKFTNICQPMLKLKTHSGFHELFRF